jgi:hypothetical protein
MDEAGSGGTANINAGTYRCRQASTLEPFALAWNHGNDKKVVGFNRLELMRGTEDTQPLGNTLRPAAKPARFKARDRM